MCALITAANIEEPDDFYAELLTIHEGRDRKESEAINARLILLLANHVGDRRILSEAMQAAILAPKRCDGTNNCSGECNKAVLEELVP
jgi:hypothetical protein